MSSSDGSDFSTDEGIDDRATVSATVVDLLSLDDDDLFCSVARRVRSLAGGGIVVIADFDETGRYRIQHVEGLGPLDEVLFEMLGRDPVGLTIPDPESGVRASTQHFSAIEGSIHELSGGRLPASVDRLLRRQAGVESMHSISLVARGRRLANVTLLAERGQTVAAAAEIERFLRSTTLVFERKVVEDTLLRKLEFERMVSRISTRFVGIFDVNQAIDATLADIGDLAGASRCYLFQIHSDDTMDNTHEWVAESVSAQKENLQGIPCDSMPWWMAQLSADELLSIEDVSTLPEEAKPEQEFLLRQDIRKLLVSPVHVGEDLGGFLGFDNTEETGVWPEEIGSLLRLGAETIGHALERKRAEDERQRLRETMLRSQKLEGLGVLAGGIAHEFNNLLMGILGNVHLARMDLDSDSPVMEELAEIVTASSRAADLCRQMLAYSGKGQVEKAELDLNQVVIESSKLVAISGSKKVAIQHNLQEQLPSIEADRSQIFQVVMNLLTNAMEAIGDAVGTIAVTTRSGTYGRSSLFDTFTGEELRQGIYVLIEVQDDGCGMEAETLARVFDPFYTTKFAGRGLGMAAALGIVHAHGGTLEVESTPDIGSTVLVLFPAVVEASEAPAPDLAAIPDRDEPATILFVDDEYQLRRVTKRALERYGYQVILAEDGNDALRKFHENADRIDLVLLDLMLPGKDGAEVLAEIRVGHPDLPVILASGYRENDVTARVAHLGHTDIIEKPYRFEDLRARIQQMLSR